MKKITVGVLIGTLPIMFFSISDALNKSTL